jgi:hypothetical protein
LVGVAVKTTLCPWQIEVAEALIATEGVQATGGGPIKQIAKESVWMVAEAFSTRT